MEFGTYNGLQIFGDEIRIAGETVMDLRPDITPTVRDNIEALFCGNYGDATGYLTTDDGEDEADNKTYDEGYKKARRAARQHLDEALKDAALDDAARRKINAKFNSEFEPEADAA